MTRARQLPAIGLLGLLAGLALGCEPDLVEETRRRIEAGAETPEALAAIEARIADVYGWADW